MPIRLSPHLKAIKLASLPHSMGTANGEKEDKQKDETKARAPKAADAKTAQFAERGNAFRFAPNL